MKVLVVGSGASGVHFARTVLERGHEVTLLDVGREGTPQPLPEASFAELKRQLPDPTAYMLGPECEGAILPDFDAEFYGIPPGREFILDTPRDFKVRSRGFAPLFSFARGGLAEAWTAGCYPLNAGEMSDFPFSWERLEPHYASVARLIGVTGAEDDLARFMPLHDGLMEPLRLDAHSERLVASYARQRERMNRELGCYLGRTRIATLTADLGARKACSYLGRCLWGCPTNSLYTPSLTLAECLDNERFEYVSGVEVTHFELGAGGRVEKVVARRSDSPEEVVSFAADRVALAAGTLTSTKIFLESARRAGGETPVLSGLMDNRQLLVPFVNLRQLGRSWSPDSYQYHLLGFGLEMDDPRDYVHCQLTTLKTTLMHPIIQKLPVDLRTATEIARVAHAALGLVNVNFRDTRREENQITLGPTDGSLSLRYSPDAGEPQRIADTVGRVKRALRRLGCIVPPGMMHVRPMGASVHYAGTLPMTREAGPWTTDEFGHSRDFENLYLVDGSTYPFLPAKNITFTLMANATRIAAEAF